MSCTPANSCHLLFEVSSQGMGGVDTHLKEIIQQVANELGGEVLGLEVMPEHVHILCEVDSQLEVQKFVKRVKGRSSGLLRHEFPQLKSILRTLGTHSYFVSTVGGPPILKQSIENQRTL